jgi:hypothetical protein
MLLRVRVPLLVFALVMASCGSKDSASEVAEIEAQVSAAQARLEELKDQRSTTTTVLPTTTATPPNTTSTVRLQGIVCRDGTVAEYEPSVNLTSDAAERALCPHKAPSVALSCPDSELFPYGSSVKTIFGHDVTEGAEMVVSWHMDYGDGRNYTSETWTDAEENLYWHSYDSPGSFVAVLTVTDGSGGSATATCINSILWTAAPPSPSITEPFRIDSCMIGRVDAPGCPVYCMAASPFDPLC